MQAYNTRELPHMHTPAFYICNHTCFKLALAYTLAYEYESDKAEHTTM